MADAPGEVEELYFMPAGGPRSTYHYLGDDYVFLRDRRTDLILSGGANIYPAEVEAAISGHPANPRRTEINRKITREKASYRVLLSPWSCCERRHYGF